MKRFVSILVVLFVLIINSSSFAKEISAGEMRFIDLDSTKTLSVHFKGIQGRTCVVYIRNLQGNREIFSENIKFDQHREERNIFVGKNKLTFFYVEKGLTVLLNDKEV
ncbi:MAG: hypothetical protein UR66_C0003G0152 [Candidatus Moranbacteria bacterium GW2011_GWE1_35_17]|nr:MAG: hypothetical protein UR66_C0003G0152 [Candidatus Moranbacteria bacterium GW2011_GWE1_35_17]KKP72517.1 MAG: hypothetical protein UR65_C0014G0030 [Candidatus Moranbacteria bacterium GW2011_GWE2_35_164]KKP81763.1 MAG: hypothetical protein UR82_C0052G0011 [Candidatus Moranbacteria bacterium GW2011_GWF1_35_5]KKP84206.1 MAG: hypothetical protein UR83_C0025G0009 [Candidatus Moranbacteria bacterium GW2011_GWF2_35_54]